jgi:hypothetical protein
MEIKYKYKNRYIISIMEFNSNNNKGLIWGLLQESNIFQGIDDKQFPKIQAILEETINNIEATQSTNDLMTKNKMAMEELIFKINTEKNKKVKSSKVQMIYTSDDLSKQREDNFNSKLKQQQDNLNTYINPQVPEEPKFKDDGDKPIGGDMDRLIAERMASRERELDIPQISKEAEEWINNSNEVKPLPEIPIDSDKKVTFDLEPEPEQENNSMLESSYNNMNLSENDNSNIKSEVNDIFSKLKRKTLPIRLDNDDDTERKWNIEELINKKEFEILLENQEKIIEFCKSIIEKLN